MVEGRTVIVVGGGVLGLAAGCALAGRGARVTVIERWRVAHERGSGGRAVAGSETVIDAVEVWETPDARR